MDGPVAMDSPGRVFRVSLLSILAGMLLVLLNSLGTISMPGMIPVSVALITAPLVLICLSKRTRDVGRYKMIFLVILPSTLLYNIYFIKTGSPVGFADPHLHIFNYEHIFSSDGRLVFANSENVSFNYVGLYLLCKTFSSASGLGIVPLASIVPPILSILIIFLIVLVIERIHSLDVAILAVIIFEFDNQVLVFGQELRTQTLGVLLIFGLLLFQSTRNKSGNTRTSLTMMIISSSLVIASFVSVFYATILFLALTTTSGLMKRKENWDNKSFLMDARIYAFFEIAFLGYLLYVSGGFKMLSLSLVNLLNGFTNPLAPNAITSSQVIYGDFVRITTYVFWGAVTIASFYYLRKIARKGDTLSTAFLVAFGAIAAFLLIDAFAGVLSAGRVYAVSFAFFATVVAFASISLSDRVRTTRLWNPVRICVVLAVIVLVSVSLAKSPQYIIGETEPVRSGEKIDTVPYWSADTYQNDLAGFLSTSAFNQNIHTHMQIQNYLFLSVASGNHLKSSIALTRGGELDIRMIGNGDLIILHNLFNGADYTYRHLLPDIEEYGQFDAVFTNGDYIVFFVISS